MRPFHESFFDWFIKKQFIRVICLWIRYHRVIKKTLACSLLWWNLDSQLLSQCLLFFAIVTILVYLFFYLVEFISPFASRLFGSKSCNKQAPVPTMESMNNSTIISNPHATSIQQNGSVNTPSVASGGSGPVYSDCLTVPSGGHGEQTLSSMTYSPGSAFSPWGGKDGLGSNHISSDSIDVSFGKEDLCLNRTNSARNVLSDRWETDCSTMLTSCQQKLFFQLFVT